MKYMLLINQKTGVAVPESVMGETLATFQKLGQELTAQRQLVHSARLRPATEATIVKLAPGAQPTVVDGPFAESNETVGGYYMIDVPSKEKAIEWAKKFPPFFTIEIRPVWEM